MGSYSEGPPPSFHQPSSQNAHLLDHSNKTIESLISRLESNSLKRIHAPVSGDLRAGRVRSPHSEGRDPGVRGFSTGRTAARDHSDRLDPRTCAFTRHAESHYSR